MCWTRRARSDATATLLSTTPPVHPLALVPAAIFVGGTLSIWQFALLHDIKHGAAVLPKDVSPNDVLFYGSLPSLFGYFLYLRFGHLTHHKSFGLHPIRDIFDSSLASFDTVLTATCVC